MLGTGFFITRLGFFMTAKHVLEEVLNQMGEPICNTSLSIIQFKENNTYYYRPIRGFNRHPEADIAIGECYPMSHKKTGEPLFNRVVPLSLTYPFIGEHIYTYAYPGTTVKQESETNHVSFNAKFYAGILNEYYPKGRDRVMLPFPCYRTSIVLHGGASGGPVFGQNGKVFGVNSTGFDGEISVYYVSRIHDSSATPALNGVKQ